MTRFGTISDRWLGPVLANDRLLNGTARARGLTRQVACSEDLKELCNALEGEIAQARGSSALKARQRLVSSQQGNVFFGGLEARAARIEHYFNNLLSICLDNRTRMCDVRSGWRFFAGVSREARNDTRRYCPLLCRPQGSH